MEKPIRGIMEGIAIAVAFTFLAMVLSFVPILNILVLLLPVPMVVVGVRRGINAAISGLVVSSILIGVLIHPFLGIILFCLNLFIVLGLIMVYKKGYGMNEAIIISAGGMLLSILVSLQAFNIMAGESFFDFIWNNLKSFFYSNSVNVEGLIDIYQRLGMLDKPYSVDRFAEIVIGKMKDLSPLFPSLLIISSLLVGGLNFLISRVILKKLGEDMPKVPSFKRWALPRGTGRGFMGLMALSAIGTWLKAPNFEVVLYTVSSIFTFIFTVQGLSVAAFFLEKKKVPGILGAFILIASFVFLSVFLTFLGVFEQIFGFRMVHDIRKKG